MQATETTESKREVLRGSVMGRIHTMGLPGAVHGYRGSSVSRWGLPPSGGYPTFTLLAIDHAESGLSYSLDGLTPSSHVVYLQSKVTPGLYGYPPLSRMLRFD